ncbi:hypothetical protein [Streptomyces hoynatensis]|uniref:Uncharacterized protein n=1 Tax=Streptomyces hoynatensis TaxID=1141874 RepID=A0A3A9YTZ7_9ACTN|nr:hypothetical protein [Streptomyces hoynatensis]RKN39455.1 hypothetical protein D7294_20865 [Streptomyces hoynatensis]
MSDRNFSFGQRVIGGLFNIGSQGHVANTPQVGSGPPPEGAGAALREAAAQVRADLERVVRDEATDRLEALLDRLDEAMEEGDRERLRAVAPRVEELAGHFAFLASVTRLREALSATLA